MNQLSTAIIFAIPFSLSLLFTPLVRLLALKSGMVANPRQDRWHKAPTALLGGVAIYVAAVVSLMYFRILDRSFLSLIIGATFLFAVGLIDDKVRITPYVKLFCQIIAACVPVFFGVIVGLPINNVFAIPITIIWIVGVTNSFNLLDNIDGLAAGVAAITAFMLFVSLSGSGETTLSFVSLVICASSLGFLPYNFNKAKIFMGDSGSMFLGYSLAVISISGTSGRQITNVLTTMLIPVLILGVPIFDTLFVMVGRKLRGKRIFEGGKDHTSHRLVMLGISQKKTVLLLYAISIIFGLIAILYTKTNLFLISVIAFCSLVVLVYFGFFLFEVTSIEEKGATTARFDTRFGNKTFLNNVFMYKRQLVEVFFDFIFICIAYYSAYFLRFEESMLPANFVFLKESLIWIILIKLCTFFMFGLYRGVWRYSSVSDFFTIFKVVSLSSIFSILFLIFAYRFREYSRAVFFIDWLLLLFLIMGSRFLFRLVGEFLLNLRRGGKNILIFGAGDMGEMVLREIKRSKFLDYNVMGFIDDDPAKHGIKIHGVTVLGGRNRIRGLVKSLQIREIMIAVATLKGDGLAEIVTICNDCGVAFRTIKGVLD